MKNKGFTLIELLVVISIIALLSAIIFSAISTVRMKARDAQRIANANQIDKALQMFVDSGSVIPTDAGLASSTALGTGLVAVDSTTDPTYRGKSIVQSLKEKGYYSNANLGDPLYGKNNYYLAYCTSTNAYSLLMNVEQSSLKMSTTTLQGYCGGDIATSKGFNYIYQAQGSNALAQGSSSSTAPGAYNPSLGAVGILDTAFTNSPASLQVSEGIGVQPDGKVIVGGHFDFYNLAPRANLARLNSDGSLDSSYNAGSGPDGTVHALVVQSDGKTVIGGDFYNINGVAYPKVARINIDGSIDSSFHLGGTNIDGSVLALAQQADGKILVGGSFKNFAGASQQYLERLNTDGTFDSTFTPSIAVSYAIRSITVQSDGKILIGGDLTTVNSAPRMGIARLNTDGTLDTTFVPGTGFDTTVYTISATSTGDIYVGGSFSSYNGTTVHGIAHLSSTGVLDTSYGLGGTGANNNVMTSKIQSDGKLVIGGYFTRYGTSTATANSIARLKPDGTLDTTFVSGSAFTGNVNGIALQADGKILAVGAMSSYGGNTISGLSRISTTGAYDGSFSTGSGLKYGMNPWNNAAVEQSDGKIIFGGGFSYYGAYKRGNIVRVNTDGSVDASYASGAGAGLNTQESVDAIALQSTGEAIIGGGFSRYNGNTSYKYIARLDASGNPDATWSGAGSGPNYVPNPAYTDVQTIAVQSDKKIIIGGYFTAYNGTSRGYIARLNLDGSLDTSFVPTGSGFDTNPHTIIIQPDGKILVGGGFTTYGGVSHPYIIRLNSDGSVDSTFTPSSNISSYVYGMALQSGKVVVVGAFPGGIIRLNADGSIDPTFTAGTGFDYRAHGAAIQSDGRIVVVGEFNTYQNASRSGVSRLNYDGSLDVAFDPGSGVTNWYADSLTIESDGKLLLAGTFSSYGGSRTYGLVRLR